MLVSRKNIRSAHGTSPTCLSLLTCSTVSLCARTECCSLIRLKSVWINEDRRNGVPSIAPC